MRRIVWALLVTISFLSVMSARAEDAPPSVDEIRAAVASGVVLAEKAAKNYPTHRQCFACHHQTLPLLAAREAERKDVMFDARLPASIADFTQNSFHVKLDSMKEGKGIGGSSFTVGYGLYALELAGRRPNETTDAMVTFLLVRQDKDGHWDKQTSRPPLEDSDLMCTVLGARGLKNFARNSQSAAAAEATAKAKAWILAAKTASGEDLNAKLWGLHLLGAEQEVIDGARAAVLAGQRDDGGWGQLSEMASDAYGTGQTLYMLHATGTAASDPVYQRGVKFLLSTRQPDGSWFVKSRSKPIQKLFDNGDPHGTSQFISTPATCWAVAALAAALPEPSPRVYENKLASIAEPRPILADHPEFVAPVKDIARFEAPPLIDEEGADLAVRAWRWSYNARGIIEMQNRLRGDRTAMIVVHPWGIDDGQGWKTPQPAGVAFQCTPAKNELLRTHVQKVVNPLVKELRGKTSLTMYSLPGRPDPIRSKLYRSFTYRPGEEERKQAAAELTAKLKSFDYTGQPLPEKITLSRETPVADYFRQFAGLDSGAKYDPKGFWDLPIPVIKDIETTPDDVVIYDAEGYEPLKQFLREQGVRHVILAGYNTDMCVCATTAGYKNLRSDFNVFLVGDATLATFPANSTPAHATNAAVSFAALDLFITQRSWITTAGN
jgi:hypothetical protein